MRPRSVSPAHVTSVPPKRTRTRTPSCGGRVLKGCLAFVGFFLAEAGLAELTRSLGRSPSPGLSLAALFAAAALAGAFAGASVYFLHRLYVSLAARPTGASYRVAFVVGGLSSAVAVSFERSSIALGWVLLALLAGAFAGGLAASARDEGLWEDNSPPPEGVIRYVLEAHAARTIAAGPTPVGKRVFDIAAAAAGLMILFPVASAICLVLWLEDPGPLFFVKNSVGRGGRNFRQWKIRTMVLGAESESGPVWSEKADQRVLRVGGLLRKTALDELPQLVNILAGQMSVVGPRPQRTVLVAEYLRRIPGYADRHRLAPGLAGLAQVAGHYYITPRQKLRFDRLYLQHAGLGFDVKLILIALAVVFVLRWRRGWNGRVPRAWLHGRRGAVVAPAA